MSGTETALRPGHEACARSDHSTFIAEISIVPALFVCVSSCIATWWWLLQIVTHATRVKSSNACNRRSIVSFLLRFSEKMNDDLCAQSTSVKYRRSSILFPSSFNRLGVVHSHRNVNSIQCFSFFFFFDFSQCLCLPFGVAIFALIGHLCNGIPCCCWFFVLLLLAHVLIYTATWLCEDTQAITSPCDRADARNQNPTLALATNSSLTHFCPFQTHQRYGAKYPFSFIRLAGTGLFLIDRWPNSDNHRKPFTVSFCQRIYVYRLRFVHVHSPI